MSLFEQRKYYRQGRQMRSSSMRRSGEFDDLDEMIAELEDSLGVDSSDYSEEDYLDTIGDFGDDDEFDISEFGDEEEEDFDIEDENGVRRDDDDF